MHFILFIFIIVCVLLVLPKSNALVATELDKNSMYNYYRQIKRFKGFEHEKGQPSSETTAFDAFEDTPNATLFKLCHFFRHARFFQITQDANETVEPRNPTRSFLLTVKQLQWEKDHVAAHRMFVPIKYNSEFERIEVFRCMDPQGVPRWFFSPGHIPDTMFVFETSTDFKYVVGRELGNVNNLAPTIKAVLDRPAKRVLDFRNMEKLVENFINSVNNSDESPDLLCKLNAILKYRLCAITSVIYRGFGLLMINETIVSQIYQDRSKNLYYQSTDPGEVCPLLTLILDTDHETEVTVEKRLLSCTMDITNSRDVRERAQFFLSFNTLNRTQLFMFVPHVENRDPKLVIQFDVPLLHHLKEYRQILEDAVEFS